MLKTHTSTKFHNAKPTYAQNAMPQKSMQEILWNLLLKHHSKDFGKILELGIGFGELSKKIAQHYPFKRYIAFDLVDFHTEFKESKIEFIQEDFEEFENFCSHLSFDLILSNAALQWSNQRILLPKFEKFLAQNGILLFSTFGKNNFKELREFFGIGLDYLSLNDYKEILQSYKILESFEKEMVLEFKSPQEVFRHLKNTGVNSLQPHFTLTKSHLKAYAEQFANKLTYHCLFILARKI